ncbi:MAG: CoA pyrophosphatase [Bacteroidetes bacterium]|nr:CoA pyrophosphatase [Bacteroidota bacterium]
MTATRTFIDKLREELSKPLPGESAQYKLTPAIRKKKVEDMLKLGPPRDSSVLVLLYPKNGELNTVFTQRHDYAGIHSNQVSFPGGKKEETDRDFMATALREAKEEMAIQPEKVEILGQLSDLLVPPSRFVIHPFIGVSEKRPDFIPQQSEVKSYFEVPLNLLSNPERIKETELKLSDGKIFKTPYYDLYGHIVWGATAMIVSEFLEVQKNIQLED